MSNNAGFDASIPVLTEVFTDRPVGEEVKPVVEVPATVPENDTHAELPEARPIGEWTGPEWDQLEHRLTERILHQLETRVDFVLEQRLRDIMHEAMQIAMGKVTDEIRRSLQQTVETIVVQVVTQELAHLQTLQK